MSDRLEVMPEAIWRFIISFFELIFFQKARIAVARYKNSKPPTFWKQYLWLLRHNLIPTVPSTAHVVIVTDKKGQTIVDEEHVSFF